MTIQIVQDSIARALSDSASIVSRPSTARAGQGDPEVRGHRPLAPQRPTRSSTFPTMGMLRRERKSLVRSITTSEAVVLAD